VALRRERQEKLEGGNMKTNVEGRLDAIKTRSAGVSKSQSAIHQDEYMCRRHIPSEKKKMVVRM
jgi:hypothetical protein